AVWFFFLSSKTDSPDQVVAQIERLTDQGNFREALEAIDGARLDEDVKRKKRDQAAEGWLRRIGEPTADNAEQVAGELEAFLQYFGGHPEAGRRLAAARARYVPDKAKELLGARDYAAAYDLVREKGEGVPQAEALKQDALARWAGQARDSLKDKD